MRLPTAITVALELNGRPAADLLVQLVLASHGHGEISTLPRATDASGRVVWTIEDILAAEAEAKQLQPRDTPTLNKHGLQRMTAVVWGQREIDWARKAVEVWGARGAYPPDYATLLDRGEQALNRVNNDDVTIVVDAGEADLQVLGESRIHVAYKPSYEASLLPGWPLVSARNS